MALLSVFSGRDRLGSIRQRRDGFEAVDTLGKSLGIFDTAASAANAIADAADKREE